MLGKVWLRLALALLLSLILGVALVQAQAANGAIRGTVYEDIDANGVCIGTGEPGLANIPVEFMSDGGTVIVLQSGQDGTYGMVGVGNGTWQVTVKPGTGFLVTSQQSYSITVSDEVKTTAGVDFCVARVTDSTGDDGALLPESGASLPPALLVTAAVGAALIWAGVFALGIGLKLRRRHSS